MGARPNAKPKDHHGGTETRSNEATKIAADFGRYNTEVKFSQTSSASRVDYNGCCFGNRKRRSGEDETLFARDCLLVVRYPRVGLHSCADAEFDSVARYRTANATLRSVRIYVSCGRRQP